MKTAPSPHGLASTTTSPLARPMARGAAWHVWGVMRGGFALPLSRYYHMAPKKRLRKPLVKGAAPDSPPTDTSSPVKQEEGPAYEAPNLLNPQTGAHPPPAETALVQATVAPQGERDSEKPASLGLIIIENYTVAAPFSCYCCVDIVLKNQPDAELHLASQEHHLAHGAFLAAEGEGMSQDDVDFVKAFDRYVEPRPAASKLALLRASVSTPKPHPRALEPALCAAAPDSLPSASAAQPQTPATSAGSGVKIMKASPLPNPRPETPARITRIGSGARMRVHHGEGTKADQALAQQILENDLEGKASPARPTKGAARPFEGPIPWYDYVCGRTLATMEEALQHFAQSDHRAATDAFLAANWDALQENDPASLQVLLSTIKARNNPSGFAERLAASFRKANECSTPAGSPAAPCAQGLRRTDGGGCGFRPSAQRLRTVAHTGGQREEPDRECVHDWGGGNPGVEGQIPRDSYAGLLHLVQDPDPL